MGNESWNDDDILGTLPEGLVGDVYIAAFGVPNFRRHPPELLRRGSIPGLWLTRWQGSSRGALLSGVPGRCPFGPGAHISRSPSDVRFAPESRQIAGLS